MARRRSALSKGGLSRLTSRCRFTVPDVHSQIACGTRLSMSFISGGVSRKWSGHIELARDEGQYRGRRVRDDRVLDAVEIGPVRLPVIRVAHDLDIFLRLEIAEFERAGADRMLAHVARAYMARKDHREAAGERHRKGRLRP